MFVSFGFVLALAIQVPHAAGQIEKSTHLRGEDRGSLVSSIEMRCGASQPDARCGKICSSSADCDSGQWCWIVHANSCASDEVRNREMMFKTIHDWWFSMQTHWLEFLLRKYISRQLLPQHLAAKIPQLKTEVCGSIPKKSDSDSSGGVLAVVWVRLMPMPQLSGDPPSH